MAEKTTLKCELCSKEFSHAQERYARSALNNHIKCIHQRKAKEKTPRKKAESAPSAPAVALAYCPCCGTNLSLIHAALQAVSRIGGRRAK